jgi:hypothetical protein
MGLKLWLERMGCFVEIDQADDGSGYFVLDVTLPSGDKYKVTVDT